MPPISTEATKGEAGPQSAGRPWPVERPSALVHLSGVTRRYGRLVALRDVDLAIEPGEFVFVIGPSEAGKTTLLKLIHGDLRPNRGAIRVDRYRLERRWRRFLPRMRRQVAAVFQDHRLLHDMTARGNVTFALQVADPGMPHRQVRATAQARLDEVGLGARGRAYPHQLSGGQQRRLAIARALGHDPVVLLADEPTANLDRANAERVLDLLEQRCAAGTTVVVATHDVELARARRHRVVELREGRILSDLPARTPLPGGPAGARLMAERHRSRPGVAARVGRVMQFLLGYTPPPPRPRRPPRPRVGVRARAGGLAQLVLGYTPPPPRPSRRRRAEAVNGAWAPPREVLERLRNGHAAEARRPSAGETPGDTNGAWRPPAAVATLAADGLARANGARNGPARQSLGGRLRTRVGRAAQAVLGYTPPPPRPPRPPRPRLGRRVGRVMQFVLGYTPPPPRPPRARRPSGRRRPWTRPANLVRLSGGGAVSSWLRNFGTSAPALGSITLLLLLAGVLSVSGFAVRSLLGSQEAEASVLRVYLSDDAADGDVDRAQQAISELPHVRAVRYVDKEQALEQARQRPGLADLASMSDSNPFPASLEVRVDSPTNVGAVARAAGTEPGVDSRRPTSYEAGTYDRLRQFTVVAATIAGGFGLLVLVVTYAISSNSIRAAVLVRRDELRTMQLVGASPWLIRSRLAVEGALTGGLAGVIAAAAVVGVCAAAFYGARTLFVQVLPGVTTVAAAAVVGGIVALGTFLGAMSALFAFRRLRT